jgi:phage tail protein X
MARGDGLRVRLAPIPGVTPSRALASRVYFPALTGDFEFTETAQHTDYRTISGGEFSVPGGGDESARDLRRLDFEVVAPQGRGVYAWLVDGTADFGDVHRALFDVLRSKQPVDFLASLSLTGQSELACDVTIRSVSRVLRHAQSGLRYFSVSVVEWRDASLRRRSTKAPPKGAFAPELPTKHKLAASDTADSLSRRYYGTPDLSVAIIAANGLGKWGRFTPIVDSAKYKVGSKITIPSPEGFISPTGGSPIVITTTGGVVTP